MQRVYTSQHSHNGPGSKRSLMRKIATRGLALSVIAGSVAIASAANTRPTSTTPASQDSKATSVQIDKTAPPAAEQPEQIITTPGNSVTSSINNGHVEVTVNGQSVQVPQGTSSQQTITTPDSNTTITVTNDSSGTSRNRQSTSIRTNTSSDTSTSQNISEYRSESP